MIKARQKNKRIGTIVLCATTLCIFAVYWLAKANLDIDSQKEVVVQAIKDEAPLVDIKVEANDHSIEAQVVHVNNQLYKEVHGDQNKNYKYLNKLLDWKPTQGAQVAAENNVYIWELFQPECLIYSIGSDGETSFEEDVIKNTHCKLHIFDPTLTDSMIEGMWKKLPADRVEIHKVGVSDKDDTIQIQYGNRRIESHIKPLADIMSDLGHEWVDVLKIDVEGYEGKALLPMIKKGVLPFGQIQMELHENQNLLPTPDIYSLLEGLQETGSFRVFHTNPNMYSPHSVWEYALVKVDDAGLLMTKKKYVDQQKKMKRAKKDKEKNETQQAPEN